MVLLSNIQTKINATDLKSFKKNVFKKKQRSSIVLKAVFMYVVLNISGRQVNLEELLENRWN